MKVYSAEQGNNSIIIKSAFHLYVNDGESIADVTWGKGAFWKDVDLSNNEFYGTDLITDAPDGNHDFNNLPFENKFLDHVILDPPYMHTVGKPLVDDNYQNSATTASMYHSDIMSELYTRGMMEARRVLKHKGYLWVKCQDEIESGKQRWSHIEIYNIATANGFYAKDLFVLMQNQKPPIQHANQKHARKNHSYLWIFQRII